MKNVPRIISISALAAISFIALWGSLCLFEGAQYFLLGYRVVAFLVGLFTGTFSIWLCFRENGFSLTRKIIILLLAFSSVPILGFGYLTFVVKPDVKPIARLNASVAILSGWPYAYSYIIVKNRDAIPWIGVEIILNDHYKLSTTVIEPGKQFIAKIVDFTKDDGKRFNPGAIKILNISVVCTNLYGYSGGIYVKQFR